MSGRLAPEQADDFLRFTRSISPEYAGYKKLVNYFRNPPPSYPPQKGLIRAHT
ncbi:hypothetical protein D1AOALGA4SA_6170 [Olavius algarvensis Delta 1 endosymbiont]|nr:hypothetical protein D1AOALGA4SA_6170 [Olavius algarvensis Delta 1 endosymbiont]